MPDFERPIRSLELHLAKTPEEAAFIRGNHAGKSAARWEIVKIAVGVVVFLAVFAWVSNMEYQDKLREEEHAKQIKELARKDADERKEEYNKLAHEAYLKTGIMGEMK